MGTSVIDVQVDPFPNLTALNDLWRAVWAEPFSADLRFSLTHLGAYADAHLVGFVNVAGDGGKHAFILDTSVRPDFRQHGIGRQLVTRAAAVARDRGAQWLHVDYEPHLAPFYTSCGFGPTAAGLIRL